MHIGIGLVIGVVIGALFGLVMGSVAIFIAIGAGIGVAVAAVARMGKSPEPRLFSDVGGSDGSGGKGGG